MTQKLSILIPAYNEENTIQMILPKVNDCSQDRTVEKVEEFIAAHPEMIIYEIR